ncbi:MAG: ABC transporter permease [Candidatus Pacebacteria bacterium]|nr:ABC transporter permease [Candidatus Paceibacterota bacterium]
MIKDLKLALFLGYKSIINGHKSTIALMIFILSLAFVNLVFVASILNGITTTINKQIINNSVAHIVIDPQEEPTRNKYIVHTKELRQQIESLPGVVATVAHYKMVATLTYDKNKDGEFKYGTWEIIGVDPEKEPLVTGISNHIIAGRYLEGRGSGDIILGSDIAGDYGAMEEFRSLGGVKVGEKVKLNFGNGTARKYTVQGISKVRFALIDNIAYITAKEAKTILQIPDDRASQILVKIDKTGNEDWYIEKIKEMAPNLKVRKWTEYTSVAGDLTKSFDLISAIISLIGLSVAAVTIFILIYVNAINKRRQIGILKAIGIKENTIIISYILQALFYAIFGIILGLIIIFYFVEPYFINHPLSFPVGDITLTIKGFQVLQGVFGLLLAAFIAGLIPAWRAAKENILKAIWGA